jgi:hypothetical protein
MNQMVEGMREEIIDIINYAVMTDIKLKRFREHWNGSWAALESNTEGQ